MTAGTVTTYITKLMAAGNVLSRRDLDAAKRRSTGPLGVTHERSFAISVRCQPPYTGC